MIQKHLICPGRLRHVPDRFSWVDHRLVRDRHIESCSHPGAALYLFLVTVADREGMSYYSDPSLMSRLSMDQSTLDRARENLIRLGLIAFKPPLYQVLSLDPPAVPAHSHVPGRQGSEGLPEPIGRIFRRMMGESS